MTKPPLHSQVWDLEFDTLQKKYFLIIDGCAVEGNIMCPKNYEGAQRGQDTLVVKKKFWIVLVPIEY